MWDVPWDELMALELAKAGSSQPSHLILHLKHFRRSENFVRVIKCNSVEEFEGREPHAVKICSVVRRTWKAYQSDKKSLILKVSKYLKYLNRDSFPLVKVNFNRILVPGSFKSETCIFFLD